MPADDEQYAHCTVCRKDVKVAMSGVYDIKDFQGQNSHKKEPGKEKTIKRDVHHMVAVILAQLKQFWANRMMYLGRNFSDQLILSWD